MCAYKKKKKLSQIQAIWNRPFVPLALILLTGVLLITALTFTTGYLAGYNSKKSIPVKSSPETSSITDIPFTADSIITPYAPDESSWNTFTGTLHYHSYSIKLPVTFKLTRSSSVAHTYTDNNNNTVTIRVPESGYIPLKKTNDRLAHFPVYTNHFKDTTTYAFDLSNEVLTITGTGIPASPFYFRQIADTLHITAEAASYTAPPVTVTGNIITLTYPASFLADTLLKDTRNCENKPESIINLKQADKVITIDANPCKKPQLLPVRQAEILLNNGTGFILAAYRNNTACILNPHAKAIHDLSLYPLPEWQFAPDASMLGGYIVQICMNINPFQLPAVSRKSFLGDLSSILSGLGVQNN